jgi:multidrug efflux pump subunit AcrA (membrane-fusion protein)
LLRDSTDNNSREIRETLKTTIEYSTYYLFQKQNVIANEDLLFHRQQDEAKNIIETIPYFLGIEEEEDIEAQQELQKTQNDLQRARYRLREEERILTDSLERELALVDEARRVGLLPTNFVTQRRDDTAGALKQAIQGWQPTITSPVKDDRLTQLNDELLALKQEFSLKLEEIEVAEAFNRHADEFSSEAEQHIMRLDSINLFGLQDGFDICPLCSTHLSQPMPKISEMRSALENLRSNIQAVERRKPKIDGHIQILRSELEEIRGQISQKKTDIENVLDELNQRESVIQQIRDSNSQIDRVVGKIEFYLDTIRTIEKDSVIRQQVEEAKNRVEQLSSRFNQRQILNIRESILDSIADQMTGWAQNLKLQYEDYRYRLDIHNLTVIASNLRKVVPMNIMGGGNYLGCHLITLLSLHKHFIEQSKPTPNFLILDQPAQGYFPQSIYKEMEGTPETTRNVDTDTVAVSRMFNFLFDVCERLSPDFQIIVLEHANLDDERFPADLVKKFQEALLVEGPWTNGQALIPEEWLNKPGSTQMALL